MLGNLLQHVVVKPDARVDVIATTCVEIDLDGFAHEARWNAEQSAIEMHIRSLRAQNASVSGRNFTFAAGMRSILRQDPDVILVGEMRDMETVDAALTAAETGHLVLSTLHTLDAVETVNRILDFFPSDLQRQVRLLLSGSLRAVISQRLLPRKDGQGRVVACEIMIATGTIKECIMDPDRIDANRERWIDGRGWLKDAMDAGEI